MYRKCGFSLQVPEDFQDSGETKLVSRWNMGNERTSANGGGRSEGLRPGAARYFRGRAPKKGACRPSKTKSPRSWFGAKRHGGARGERPSLKPKVWSLFSKKKSGRTGLFRREEATRTPDPYVPNVVRYQLRYFSKKKRGISPRSESIKKACRYTARYHS